MINDAEIENAVRDALNALPMGTFGQIIDHAVNKLALDHARLRREIEVTVKRADAAEALLARLVDDEPCTLDHNGACQTHSSFDGPCAVDEARRLLAARTKGETVKLTIMGSHDRVTWETLHTETLPDKPPPGYRSNFKNDTAYKYYRTIEEWETDEPIEEG